MTTTDHAAEALSALELADTYRDDGAARSADRCLYTALVHATRALVDLAQPPTLVYRAEINSMNLGHYTTRAAAEQHCEADLHANIVLEHRTLRWIPENDSDAAVSELAMIDRAGDDEATGYMITPIELQATYDPNAEG